VLLCCCVSEQPNFFYWDALEMLRKALITGVIMFVSKGSLFQIVVALFFSLGFAFSAAWCQPYANQKANMYKVAVEISLIATLTLGPHAVLRPLHRGAHDRERRRVDDAPREHGAPLTNEG
jgi:hypothetical protein